MTFIEDKRSYFLINRKLLQRSRSMKERLLKLREIAIAKTKDMDNLKEIEELRIKFLGKKGELTAILREMGKLAADCQ